MTEVKKPQKVKLITALIFKKDYMERILCRLKRKFGLVDFQSDIFEFKHTSYYDKEMGSPLYRQFISFKKLISPDSLWKVKLYTNRLEKKFSRHNKRQVNIDPGYIALPKLILASAKNFSHRVYLKGGIYAEVTLIYEDDEYKALKWTFPEYRFDSYREIFKTIRNLYAKQIKEGESIS